MALPGYTFDTEADDLKRRQQIADAMQGGALAPLEMPSTPGARVSPLHILTKMMQGYAAKKQGEGLKQERAALGQRYTKELSEGLEKFNTTSSPQQVPFMSAAGPEGPMPEPVQDGSFAVPGNRRKAIMDAIASNHPVLKDLGMEEFKAMNKANAPLSTKDLLPHASPEAIPGMITGGTGAFKPKADVKEVNGVVYNPSTMEILQLKGKPPEQITVGGDLYEVNPSTRQLKKLDNAPKITIDNGGGNAFGKAVAGARADTLKKSFENAQTLPQTLSSIQDASNALSAGVKSGATGEIALAMAKVGKSFGLPDDPAIANTEQYRSSVAQSVLKVLEKLKPASDTDVKFAQEVAGGKITLDDNTMMRLLDTAKAATWNAHMAHEGLIERNMQAPGGAESGLDAFRVPMDIRADATKFDFNPDTKQFSVKNSGIPGKGEGKPNGGKPMTLDDYLKSKGVQ